MLIPLRTPLLRLLGGVFCVAFLITFFIGLVGQNRFLFHAFAFTEAKVTITEPANHGRLYYSYAVQGTSLIGSGSGSALPGTTIKIFYLLSDSSVSTSNDPSGGFAELFAEHCFREPL